MGRISIDGTCYLWWAVLLLVVPIRWLAAIAAAAAVHELCHYVAVLLLGGTIHTLFFRPGGIHMAAAPMEKHQEIIASLAGPIGSLLLLLFVRWFPLTALCGLIQGVWNLIPFAQSDGYRVLNNLASMAIGDQRSDIFCRRMSRAIGCIIILSATVVVTTAGGGFLPMILLLISVLRPPPEKYLANPRSRGYNKGYHI